MRKLYLLLLILFLIYWGCEYEQDTTPTEVTLWGEVYSVEDTDTLYLSGNELTGSIPSEIGNLTNLRYLNLNDNELTGSIPPETGNLTHLTYLNLKSNQLSGIIPEEICNIGDSTPSLSNNQFCPPYPSCIENMDSFWFDISVGVQDTTNCN